MAPLHEDLRRGLERAVVQAREIAERGAEAALDRLAVSAREPHSHMSVNERVLRNRLRARARALGDTLRANGVQDTGRLGEEVAYEAWHRMLFARFLAENQLLVHPEHGIPVSLAECEELAAEEGAEDRWVLAARYASRMLPQIFRPDDPALQILFAPEHRVALERLLEELPAEVFRADDSLGWVYQFWQAKRKKEVNEAGEAITGETLPAVTQLFTEPYMVSFLLENTVGACWSARHPSEALPVEMPYLRRLEDGTPAAGAFEGWPTEWREFTMLDPCCGSGHFLVAALRLLVPLRMHDEGLDAAAAVNAVLRENLHGLELDARCTQIAAFAVALAAWTTPGATGYRPLPELQIACSGLAVGAKREEWAALAEGDHRIGTALGRLHELFKLAPELGSLIDPAEDRTDLLTASFDEVAPLLRRALGSERVQHDEEREATVVAAQGITKAATLLARRYALVATNVPYLGRGKQGTVLREFTQKRYSRANQDLATVFLERCIAFCAESGSACLVLPQNWLFLSGYTDLRRSLLKNTQWNFVVRLGESAFASQQAAGAFVALACLTRRHPPANASFMGIEVSEAAGPAAKQAALAQAHFAQLDQARQLRNPDACVAFAELSDHPAVDAFASNHQGLSTGDNPRFRRSHWEVPSLGSRWVREQSAVDQTMPYGGREGILLWDGGNGELRKFGQLMVKQLHNVDRRGQEAWSHRGIAISQMRELCATLYTGEKFDTSVAVLIPRNPEHLPALWAFCSSDCFNTELRKLNPKVSVDNGYFGKAPLDLPYWTEVARAQYPGGLPATCSDDPTQWLFRGEIPSSTAPLQVAAARLLGYSWPDQPADAHLDPLTDADGIVCLPAARGEQPAADRLQAVLAAAYGADWALATRDTLLADAGHADRTLDAWLRDGFFEQHCKLFHNRPFIWHITDGAKDGFSALVNYHKLDRKTLEALTYTYLGDWINRQEEAKARDERGADVRLAKAKELQEKLRLIIEGEPPYDIFVRWKPLHEQPSGWEPDLNDGVRVNIWPFVQAGILRSRVNVNWKKDRGKNPAGSFWGEDRYNRYEDIPRDARPAELRDVEHLTNNVKREARKAHESGTRPAAPRKLATSRR